MLVCLGRMGESYNELLAPLVMEVLQDDLLFSYLSRLLRRFPDNSKSSHLHSEIKTRLRISRDGAEQTILRSIRERINARKHDAPASVNNEGAEHKDSSCLACCDELEGSKKFVCLNNACTVALCRPYAFKAVRAQIDDGAECIRCTVCRSALKLEEGDLELLGTEKEELERLVERQLYKLFEQQEGKLKPCNFPDCPNIVPVRELEGKTVYSCCLCGQEQCAKCEADVHEGYSCDEFKKGDKEMDELVKKNIVQFCPSCKAPSVRIDACAHVTCAKCKTKWNYAGDFRKGKTAGISKALAGT